MGLLQQMVADRPNVILVPVLPGRRAQEDSNRDLATRCLDGRFTQGVNLRVRRSKAVRSVRGRPLVTAVFRLLWHGCGTDGDISDGCQLVAPEAVDLQRF